MNKMDWDSIDGFVVSCTQALFESCGVTIWPDDGVGVEESADSPQMLAVIGFGGSALRGALLLSAPREVFARAYPGSHGEREVDDEELRDWAGELVNQLLGRIKNKLLARGVGIAISTPTALSAVHVRVGAAWTNAACVPHRFATAGAALHMRFEAVAAEGACLSSETKPLQLGESDMLFF